MMFTPISEKKVWGEVIHVFASTHVAVSSLTVKYGFCCSRHRHKHRANLFAVQQGSIYVEEWRGDRRPDGARTLTLLAPGDTHVVPSGVWHRFRVIESGKLVEVYWADKGGVVRLGDIERIDQGGPDFLTDVIDC